MAATAQDLHNAIAVVCPIDGVSVGNWTNKETWRIDYAEAATAAQKAAGATLLAGFDPTAPSYADKLAAGCAITSPTRAYLNGTYAIDTTMQGRVQAIADRIANDKAFPHSGATYNWPISGGSVTFKATQDALDVFTALCDYVSDLLVQDASVAAGNTANWPAQPVTIT